MSEKKLLILLHGYGANGMDLMPIGDYIKNAVTRFDLDYFAPDAFEYGHQTRKQHRQSSPCFSQALEVRHFLQSTPAHHGKIHSSARRSGLIG